MTIREVIETINRLQADGVIDRYAIGGAVGATFYLEPVATIDVDVFIELHAPSGSPIITPKPIFDYLLKHGCVMQGEYVIISGWPVQFLPPTSPLVEEALEEAVEKNIGNVRTRVFTAEHLAVIALATGRAKDKARLLQFLEAGAVQMKKFESILTRHALLDRWRQFKEQFLNDHL
jgi:hypothetical protein